MDVIYGNSYIGRVERNFKGKGRMDDHVYKHVITMDKHFHAGKGYRFVMIQVKIPD